MTLRRTGLGRTALVVAVAAAMVGTASAALALRGDRSARDVVRARQASVAPIRELRVLARPQTAVDKSLEATPAVATMLDALPPVDPSSFRVGLRGVGSAAHAAFVVRGRDGRTCAGLTDFSSGCLDGLPSTLPVDVTYGGGSATEGPIVWGLARDDVRAVDVVLNGVAQPAVLGDNVYVFQAEPGIDVSALGALKVHLASGAVVTVPVG
jgi:hypothetical protein